MAQQSEPVYIIQRSKAPSTNWLNVRVSDDRADARAYVKRMNARTVRYLYRVAPGRVTKL